MPPLRHFRSSPHQLLVGLARWDAQGLHLGSTKTLSYVRRPDNSQRFFELKAKETSVTGPFAVVISLLFVVW